MSRKIAKTLTYDAPIAAVRTMLLDPAFRKAVLEAQHVASGTAHRDGDVITLEQTRAAHVVPSFARKFVGDEIVIVQTETWSTPDHADIEVTIADKPGELSGTATLVEANGRTVETIHLEVTVRVPLIGGKIESVIAELFAKGLDKEQQVGVAWLAR